MSSSTTPILITPGEPAGIGPDLSIELAQHEWATPLVAIADPTLLHSRAKQLGKPVALREASALDDGLSPLPAGALYVLPCRLKTPVETGRADPANAPYILESLDKALALCRAGKAGAMVTGPVNKAIINQAGIAFTGHTEYLAERTKTPQVVMMLAAGSLRVALATTHLPLAKVPQAITSQHLLRVLQILHTDLQTHFGIAQPRITVCGLNPHAGENGHLGREEIEIIEPVIKELNASGLRLTGPVPADTAFLPHYLQRTDAYLAMYHDQGLPVLKYAGFGNAVNITLGLPFIRTSVDHGTALELAGTGRAEAGSMQAAVALAIELADKQQAVRRKVI